MIALGIETSGTAGSVALVRDGQPPLERMLSASGRRHARTLIPELGDLLRSVGLTPQDLTLVAVGIGPGSFTGLRVGVVCAKTLAYAVGAKLVGVDSFLAVAATCPIGDRLWVIDDALRGDIFAGEYQNTEAGWQCLVTPALRSFEIWKQGLPDGTIISGPGVGKFEAELEQFRLVDPSWRSPLAKAVAELGVRLAEQGMLDDPWRLAPNYIRRSAAEEKADGVIS